MSATKYLCCSYLSTRILSKDGVHEVCDSQLLAVIKMTKVETRQADDVFPDIWQECIVIDAQKDLFDMSGSGRICLV